MTLSIIQIVISIALIVLILLQERSAGLSGLMGGDSAGGVYQTRRGLERIIFSGTIVLTIAFLAIALVQIVL